MTRVASMTKPALEQHCAAMRQAIGEMLRRVRTPGGTCLLCEAPAGEQHTDSCPVWPVIIARSEYAGADEGELDL